MQLAGKKVLVTGARGFLGKHLVARLVSKDARVYDSARYDLRYADQTYNLWSNIEPDLVIHCAANVGGIGANMAQPGAFFYDNLMMGANIIEASRLFETPKTITLGTVCAYPKYTPAPFHEDYLWEGYPEETNAPYAFAKKMMLVQGQAYRKQYDLNVVHLIPVNLYGPGDNFDLETSHVIPALIRKVDNAVKTGAPVVEVWGTGTPTREFLYVDDCVDGIILAAERYDGPLPINLGNGLDFSISDITKIIADKMNFKGQIVFDTSKPDGQPKRQLDTSRAEELLDFEAKTSLDAGLDKTINWYKKGFNNQ